MKAYECVMCGRREDAQQSMQGGKLNESLPTGWASVTMTQAKTVSRVVCGSGCAQIIAASLKLTL